jgi:hypothetical protein
MVAQKHAAAIPAMARFLSIAGAEDWIARTNTIIPKQRAAICGNVIAARTAATFTTKAQNIRRTPTGPLATPTRRARDAKGEPFGSVEGSGGVEQ